MQVRDRAQPVQRTGVVSPVADVVVVRKGEPWKVTAEVIQSKCKWSPVEGDEFAWKVEQTFCNGHLIYNKGVFDAACRGEELEFRNNS